MVKNPESLQNEIEILKKLDHPMIVRLYETFEDEKNIYLVQEYPYCYSAFARVANSLKDWSSMETLIRKMPGNSSHKSSNAFAICIPKR
jgi:serine/threonine protein kinase